MSTKSTHGTRNLVVMHVQRPSTNFNRHFKIKRRKLCLFTAVKLQEWTDEYLGRIIRCKYCASESCVRD